MRRARLGLCSHIVVYDFDRFSRERVTSWCDYEDLERLGIELHYALRCGATRRRAKRTRLWCLMSSKGTASREVVG